MEHDLRAPLGSPPDGLRIAPSLVANRHTERQLPSSEKHASWTLQTYVPSSDGSNCTLSWNPANRTVPIDYQSRDHGALSSYALCSSDHCHIGIIAAAAEATISAHARIQKRRIRWWRQLSHASVARHGSTPGKQTISERSPEASTTASFAAVTESSRVAGYSMLASAIRTVPTADDCSVTFKLIDEDAV